MPQLIKHIDEIARAKQRDVLAVEFIDLNDDFADLDEDADRPLEVGILRAQFDSSWEDNEAREIIIKWLDENGIRHSPCGHLADECLMMGYRGQIYIDVPYDKSDPIYQKLEFFLENPDGSMKFEGMRFMCYTLKRCMKNAHHDEPGFWEKWAENF